MHKILSQRKRNFLQNILMLIGCLSAILSFGTCNGNLGGFAVCAVKNNLGILVVVLIPKRARFELNSRFYLVEATVENKCTASVRVFKTTIMQGAEKMYQAFCPHRPRSNRKREYAARTVSLIVSYFSNGKR